VGQSQDFAGCIQRIYIKNSFESTVFGADIKEAWREKIMQKFETFLKTQKIFSSGFSSLNVFKAGFFKAKLSCTSRGQRLNVI
jgi:hypothetical protein